MKSQTLFCALLLLLFYLSCLYFVLFWLPREFLFCDLSVPLTYLPLLPSSNVSNTMCVIDMFSKGEPILPWKTEGFFFCYLSVCSFFIAAPHRCLLFQNRNPDSCFEIQALRLKQGQPDNSQQDVAGSHVFMFLLKQFHMTRSIFSGTD